MALHRRGKGEAVLFSCLLAFVAGLVIAAASLLRQRAAIEAFAKRAGYELVDE
jgi:uncharacterized membrane protein